MKAVFIVYSQSHTNDVQKVLDRNKIRGFTQWDGVMGRGMRNGEPHYGSHAWPGMNLAVLAFVKDERVESLLSELHELDLTAEQQGLRAFTWPVDDMPW